MPIKAHFLPATYGDCIWVEYGDGKKMHHIIIDGGTGGTKKKIEAMIEALPADQRHFELMVVTHVDKDHIEGLLKLLEQDQLSFTVGDFWFNGWFHLPGNENKEAFGAKQGERLTTAILKHKLSWNGRFGKNAVVVPDNGELPVIRLDSGASITLLSPYKEHLKDLKPKWVKELEKQGLLPGYGSLIEKKPAPKHRDAEAFGIGQPDVEKLNNMEHHEDDSEANASSIAFLFEYQDKCILLAGDAFPSVVLKSLEKKYKQKAPIHLTKLSHHGSCHNTSPELIEKLECNKYVFSTNGSSYYHPSQETVAWVISRGGKKPHLYFNYTSDENKMWNSLTLKGQHDYKATFGINEGIVVEL